jgi:hypothetical protein
MANKPTFQDFDAMDYEFCAECGKKIFVPTAWDNGKELGQFFNKDICHRFLCRECREDLYGDAINF